MANLIKESDYKIRAEILSSEIIKLSAVLLILFFVFNPGILFSQSFPDTALYNKTFNSICQNTGQMPQSKKPEFKMMRLSISKSEQCVSVSSVANEKGKKNLLIFWQKDTTAKWVHISYVISSKFSFTDLDKDGVKEVECIDKENYGYRRDKNYRLLSFKEGKQMLMYSYHQYEYYNSSYIMNNFAFDSVFSVKHNVIISDLDKDNIPELVDNIEIKYRKQPCCDPHLEYGIREKKLVLRLINGKFELY